MKLLCMSAALLLSLATPALAQFNVDLTPAEMRARLKTPAIADLAVGEVGLLYLPRFCVSDTALMIYAKSTLAESASDYYVNYKVRREPGGSVSLTSTPGAKSSSTAASAISTSLTDYNGCDRLPVLPEDLLPVASIDGITKLSDLVVSKP